MVNTLLIYLMLKTFKYQLLWEDLDDWAEKNKYPSWKRQKDYIITIAPTYGIKLTDINWKKIFKIYDELHKKCYFLGWDIDSIPWLEAKIETYSKEPI